MIENKRTKCKDKLMNEGFKGLGDESCSAWVIHGFSYIPIPMSLLIHSLTRY